MTGLTGRSDHNLDAKGRLILPARFRQALSGGFYLSPGYHQSRDGSMLPNLTIYPMDTWEAVCSKVDALAEEDSSVADMFFAYSELCQPDSQFRIVIPQNLRAYAQLTKSVVLTGRSSKIILWDAQLLQQAEGMRLDTANVAAMMRLLR